MYYANDKNDEKNNNSVYTLFLIITRLGKRIYVISLNRIASVNN